MSSEGPYARYTAPSSKTPYGQSYSSGYSAPGYGAPAGEGYGSGQVPGYGGASYSAPQYSAAGPGTYGQVCLFNFTVQT